MTKHKNLCIFSRFLAVLYLSFVIASGMTSCARTLDTKITNSSQVVIGASNFEQGPSLCDSGLLFQKDCNFHFYDIGTKTDYILCSNPNCRHNNASCSAWLTDFDAATGLALFGDHVYVIKRNDDRHTYDAVQMDITGENQKVLASIPEGEFKPGEWVLMSVRDVVYASGSMWFAASYDYVEQKAFSVETNGIHCDILYGIQLSTGNITRLNEFPDPNAPLESVQNPTFSIAYITPYALLYEKSWCDPPFLGEEAFLKSDLFEHFADSRDPFVEYIDWHLSNTTKTVETYILNLGQNTTDLLYSEQLSRYEDKYGIALLPTYGFAGYQKDSLLLYTYDWINDMPLTKVYSLDYQTKETTIVFDNPNGSPQLTSRNGFQSSTLDGNKLLYCQYADGNLVDIFLLDLKTGENTWLYQDEYNIRFRIYGETTNYILATIHGEYSMSYYKISKKDYYKGNIDASEKLFTIFY